MNWLVYDHYGYALVAVIGTFIALAGLQWVIQCKKLRTWNASLQGVAPPFINIIGVLFALTLAFLANDTWIAHDRAVKAVYKEADSLHAIATLSQKLPDPLKTEVRQAVVAYAEATVAEWPDLASRTVNPDVSQRTDALFSLLASTRLASAAGDNVQEVMLRKMSEISDERDQRIALSQTHVNPLKWLGMGFLGLLTLISVAIVHLDRPRAAFAAMLLFALAAAPTAAIVLVQGNPFQPPSNVTPTPIIKVVESIQKPLAGI
ncbi:MAG: DUF4239 domain-containing protein [Fluviibacter phosphoraccumulans]|uniref:bestrophin-like domain n=1 Tax=Fluviibacter phosphoraccumulans TaxID=1751046 RepID=UPI0024E233CB|nr:DUF4239 domain-containing protein [Fluviibacter phosphoraccumulans]